MEPLHFSSAGRRLFGLRFESVTAPRHTAILLCSSWGVEYMRSYRGLSLLGQALAERGFETMRFDYSCTGDSYGRTGEARLPMWIEDIARAARELADVGGTRRLCVIGLRLGALLAMRAMEQGLRIDNAVLWDAPASGAEWIAQQRALEIPDYARKNRYRARHDRIESHRGEIMGMPIDEELSADLSSLQCIVTLPTAHTLQIRSKDATLPSLPSSAELRLPDAAHWLEPAWINTPWTPTPSLNQIADHLAGWLP